MENNNLTHHCITDRSMNILSMGGGVNSVAELLRDPSHYGHCVFADPGAEKPETYFYLKEYIKPFCEKHNIKYSVVYHRKNITLEKDCIDRKTLPNRATRWCTREFKVQPMNRYARDIGANRKNPVSMHICISMDESHRLNTNRHNVLYVKKEYPLIDTKITRQGCIDIIEDHGWPIPLKSGCDFCPFRRKKEMVQLRTANPQRFAEIKAMEQNDKHYPKYPLMSRYKLEDLENNQTLTSFIEEDDDSCDDGYCMR